MIHGHSSRGGFDERDQVDTWIWPQEDSRDSPAGRDREEAFSSEMLTRAAGYP